MSYITIFINITGLFFIILGFYLCKNTKNRLTYYTKRTKFFKYYKYLLNLMNFARFKKYNRKQRVEREIYEGISFMRNILSLNGGRQVRADIIIEKLAEKKGVLQPIYVKMLGSLRLNRASEAVEIFNRETGLNASENEFASLLIRWDDMNPEELGEILLSIQRAARERRITEHKKRDEMISDLVYLPVVLNVLFIFINFLYVSFFLDQQEALSIFF